MSSVEERAHLSIGEVLSLLQEDFPDVTISKIRFLESQGLLDPERTPSGYRKFYDDDIARLRWILRQQRENFLPLKVIKDRLAKGEAEFAEVAGGRAGAERAGLGTQMPAGPTDVSVGVGSDHAEAPAVPGNAGEPPPAAIPSATETGTPTTAGPTTAGPTTAVLPIDLSIGAAPPALPAASDQAPVESTNESRRNLLDEGPVTVSMTIDELSRATGLSAREISELEGFGMIAGIATGSATHYDQEALTVARLAAAFRGHGVEPRHLRMFKMAAQREVGLFEQMLLPILRKTSSQAKAEAAELATELVGLGDELRTAMLRQHLRDYIDRA